MSGFGVYVHFPFCRSKCPYCDFNSVPVRKTDGDALKKAYAESLRLYASRTRNRRVTSVFFGGGTPSLADVDVIESVLKTVRGLWDVAENAEVSLEGNPDSLTVDKMRGLRDIGVNRLSVGVQSFDERELRFLGRLHGADAARDVLENAVKLFENVSADFIYTLPNQSPEQWLATLNEAVSLNLPHLSLYQLTLEEGSAFERLKKVVLPDEETSAEMYALTDAVMQKAGYRHYEVSNFARSESFECRHNLIYWQGDDYIGVGAGACGRFREGDVFCATEVERNPEKWLEIPTAATEEKVTLNERATELLMMGLRLEKGVERVRFQRIIGKNPEGFLDEKAVSAACADGFLIVDDNGIRVTSSGRLILNRLLVNLLV